MSSSPMKRHRSGRDMATPFKPETKMIPRHDQPNRGQKPQDPDRQNADKMTKAKKVTEKRIGLTDMINKKYYT